IEGGRSTLAVDVQNFRNRQNRHRTVDCGSAGTVYSRQQAEACPEYSRGNSDNPGHSSSPKASRGGRGELMLTGGNSGSARAAEVGSRTFRRPADAGEVVVVEPNLRRGRIGPNTGHRST